MAGTMVVNLGTQGLKEITMTQQLKGAILCAVVAVVFITLQIALDIQTGTAGVFVMGVAGGLLIANQMTKPAAAWLPH